MKPKSNISLFPLLPQPCQPSFYSIPICFTIYIHIYIYMCVCVCVLQGGCSTCKWCQAVFVFLHLMPSRFNHLITNCHISFFFSRWNDIPLYTRVCTYHIVFIHSHVIEYKGCFHETTWLSWTMLQIMWEYGEFLGQQGDQTSQS